MIDRRNLLLSAATTLAAAPFLRSGRSDASQKSPAPKSKTNTQPRPDLSLNIRDFGAIGNGTTKDTDALRLAIERCSFLGGGQVVPAGDYLVGGPLPSAFTSSTNLSTKRQRQITSISG